ncbi:SUKH-4 family immunity protein [Streptosporangium sp. NPDC048865]|uniref:SUKH-4 family immunity protein n=1 Tax=Streptosporangium sp. NPDC048865 TaxID=3155766 RepID=UPI003413F80D
MSPLIDRTAMESVFPAGELVTLDDRTPAVIAHEPTRTFLREVGLPDRSGWFETDQRLLDGDPRVGGDAWRAVARRYPSCPFDMSAWLTLGGIAMDDVVVDTITGVVYSVPEDGSPHLLNTSVDALAYFLHALEEERPEYDAEAATDEGVDPGGAERRLLRRMRRADAAAVEPPGSTWLLVLRHVRDLMRDR